MSLKYLAIIRFRHRRFADTERHTVLIGVQRTRIDGLFSDYQMHVVKTAGFDGISLLIFTFGCYVEVCHVIGAQKDKYIKTDVFGLVFFRIERPASGDIGFLFTESGRRVEYVTAVSAYCDVIRVAVQGRLVVGVEYKSSSHHV